MADLTQERVSAVLSYNGETGDFTWRRRDDVPEWWNTKYAGNAAGSVRGGDGYRRIDIYGRKYKANRIAWILAKGAIPPGLQIDHVNGVRDDNRIANLKLATNAQNRMNARKHGNSSLPKGVSFHRLTGKYQANIQINGVFKYLGLFATPAVAHDMYSFAADLYHGEFARFA